MKTVKNVLVKYYLSDEDRQLVHDHLTYDKNKGWLADQLGYKNYVTFWRKFSSEKPDYFYQMEIEKMQDLLGIKFEVK